MKSIYKLGFLFVIIFSFASSCEENKIDPLREEMVEFDKAFVPVLYHVLKDEMAEAKKSVFFLDHTWQKFERKFHQLNPENDDWQEAFRMTKAWLADAYYSIDANSQKDAFIFLDHVRYQMIELRSQQNIRYYLDEVWEFEASLDLAVEVAVDQMLCLLDYCEFEEIVGDLNFAFNQMEQARMEPTLFKWDNTQIENFKHQQQRLKAALLKFNLAVAEASGDELVNTAILLNQTYWDFLQSFGDFTGSQTYFAVK